MQKSKKIQARQKSLKREVTNSLESRHQKSAMFPFEDCYLRRFSIHTYC